MRDFQKLDLLVLQVTLYCDDVLSSLSSESQYSHPGTSQDLAFGFASRVNILDTIAMRLAHFFD
jgi:hypothetical protein